MKRAMTNRENKLYDFFDTIGIRGWWYGLKSGGFCSFSRPWHTPQHDRKAPQTPTRSCPARQAGGGYSEGAFGGDIDYAMLVKVYGPAPKGQHRYSPPQCNGAHKHRVEGNPDPKHVSTSFVERQNLNIRMGNRRMTRLTNAFSKKAENHAHMMAIYFMHYNFVRIHQTLKVTPAMAAGVTGKLWEMADLVAILEEWEAAN